MLKPHSLRWLVLASAAALAACSWTKQPAAPVVAGTDSGNVYSPTQSAGNAASTNPYGAAPYTPEQSSVPYTPTATPAQTYTPPAASSGTYVGNYAPVDVNATTHRVVSGDTVYNISKRYGISQDDLRAWNGLADNNIRLGQTLRVKPSGYVAPAATSQTTSSAPAAVKTPAPAAATTAVVSGATQSVAGITWQTPTAGKVVKSFNGSSSKGVDIAGTRGQAVLAAADGKVVYSGNGLRGYGNLLIIQHNKTYLTAYGHNDSLLVKEGQQVKRGQKIATMGSSDADGVKLHFEVRENGTPVNPTRFVKF